MTTRSDLDKINQTERKNVIASKVSLDGMVFGMPPGTHVSDAVLKASMPTATITPCEPRFSKGLSLFNLDEDKGKKAYDAILEDVGFHISKKGIEVAYLADNFPTDTFNNEYGETFLDKFAQVASSGLGDLSQIMGWTNFEDMTKQLKAVGEAAEGATGGLGSTVGGLARQVGQFSGDTFNKITGAFGEKGKQMGRSMVNTMKAIATGARVDFPQVWKNSSYTPSYTMTIRLYNPNPADPVSTQKYIVGPIAALVALGVPKVAEDATTYKWPLLCKVRSPGIYHLNAAYINSIAVIKGGDQQSIAYNQNLAMCDVRIDFGSLYNSILAGPGSTKWGNRRPTLGSYLEGIGGKGIQKNGRRKRSYKSKGPSKSSEEPANIVMKKNNATADPVTPSDAPKARTTANNRETEILLDWGR